MAEGMWLPSILNCSLVSWFQGTDSGYMVPSIVKCTKIFKYQSTKTRIDNLFSWNICYWTLPRSKFPFIHLTNVLLGGYAVYISLRNQYSRYIVWGKPVCILPFERTNQATTFFFFFETGRLLCSFGSSLLRLFSLPKPRVSPWFKPGQLSVLTLDFKSK